jgi:hypothetical protein
LARRQVAGQPVGSQPSRLIVGERAADREDPRLRRRLPVVLVAVQRRTDE